MQLKQNKSAFSLIELLIAFVILVVISGAVYSVLSSTRNVAELAQAKEEAKGTAEIVLKHLQQDIAASHAEVDKTNIIDGKPSVTPTLAMSGGSISMKIPAKDAASAMVNDYVDVVYSMDGTKLYREDGNAGNKRLLSSNVSKLDVFMLSEDQVSVEIETSVQPRGHKEPVKHNQKILVTIREAVVVNSDKRWLSSEEALQEY